MPSGGTSAEEATGAERSSRTSPRRNVQGAAGRRGDDERRASRSDIGCSPAATGADPTPEDVWAQYDFKCAVSDVLEYAEYLGMDIKEDAHLLWIADEALQAPEPQGWEQRLDPKGGVYYYHPTTGMSLNQHPLDHHYQQFYLQMKAQYDAMYTAEKKQKEAAQRRAATPARRGSATPSMSTTADGMSEAGTPAPEATSEKKKGGILGKRQEVRRRQVEGRAAGGDVRTRGRSPPPAGRPRHRADARQHHRRGRGGRVRRRAGRALYGDQIIMVDSVSLR